MDPKLRGRRPPVWAWLEAAVVFSLALLQGAFLYAALRHAQGVAFPLEGALLLGIGLVFLALGFLLPRLPPNHLAGVRTPWTLESPAVWRKTHRLAGFVFGGLGLLAWVAAGLGPWGIWLWIAGLFLSLLFLVGYSYLAWRRERA